MLEVGCGTGVALPILRQLCDPDRLVGLDVNRGALAAAARNIRHIKADVELIQADVRSMPFGSETFDIVLDFGTCYHIAHGKLATREIERVLKPRGVFVTETKLNQFLSHPVRSFGRALLMPVVGTLQLRHHRGLWMSFEKQG